MQDFLRVIRRSSWLLGAALIFAAPAPALAQSGAPPSAASAAPVSANEAELLKSAETFVRKLFAWGADFQVKLGQIGRASCRERVSVPV
jgi:hypothetical protein